MGLLHLELHTISLSLLIQTVHPSTKESLNAPNMLVLFHLLKEHNMSNHKSVNSEL